MLAFVQDCGIAARRALHRAFDGNKATVDRSSKLRFSHGLLIDGAALWRCSFGKANIESGSSAGVGQPMPGGADAPDAPPVRGAFSQQVSRIKLFAGSLGRSVR